MTAESGVLFLFFVLAQEGCVGYDLNPGVGEFDGSTIFCLNFTLF